MSFNEHFIANYNRLVRLASRVEYPEDLIHDLYIEGMQTEITNYDAWWNRAIWTMTMRGKYYNQSTDLYTHPQAVNLTAEEPDYTDPYEEAFQVISRLDEFDRTVFLLYLKGHCLTCVASETGISYRTIIHSIEKTKQCLLNHSSTTNG